MVDLVGTCPKDFWEEWIAEGDPAGTMARFAEIHQRADSVLNSQNDGGAK